jgi:hypothetical protein
LAAWLANAVAVEGMYGTRPLVAAAAAPIVVWPRNVLRFVRWRVDMVCIPKSETSVCGNLSRNTVTARRPEEKAKPLVSSRIFFSWEIVA